VEFGGAEVKSVYAAELMDRAVLRGLEGWKVVRWSGGVLVPRRHVPCGRIRVLVLQIESLRMVAP